MTRWLLLACVASACSKSAPEPEPAPTTTTTILKPDEIQRAEEACNGYLKRVCLCASTTAAVKDECRLAATLPEAIDVAKRLAANPKTERVDALQAADSVRKTVKQCIERTAKLPSLGCP